MILKPRYDHRDGTLGRPEYVRPARFLVIEGLLNFHTETLRTAHDIRVFLATSGEFWANAGRTNRGFVTRLFPDVFGRPASAAEVSNWTTQLDHGLRRNNVVTTLLNAAEGRHQIVVDMFVRFLRRLPTAP